jgi:hypothetical protein
MATPDKALEAGLEAVKQQITLATALIGAALAFTDQIDALKHHDVRSMLPWGFGLLGVSVISGVLVLMAISYELRGGRDPFGGKRVRLLGALQNLAFMIAVGLLAFTVSEAAG